LAIYLSLHSWLSVYLGRASYLLRVAGVQHEMSREELERRYEKMQKHVVELQVGVCLFWPFLTRSDSYFESVIPHSVWHLSLFVHTHHYT